MIRGRERAARASARAIVLGASLVASLAGCTQPVVGAPARSGQAVGGPSVEITGASIDGTGHLVATLRITRGGVPVATQADAVSLQPLFTLAALSVHPVDGLASWKSLLLTGGQTLPQLPPGGPGTPAGQILANVRQPGAEGDGTLAGAEGAFTYTFANALPVGFDPAETLRVGVWLLGNGTADGTSTFDFRPAGGTPPARDTVLGENCQRCHAVVVSPRGAVGVKMCLTCHTWQNADPDTKDPAALDAATAATDPNPLDLGRMVHRIHRGANLPTLYQSSSTAAAPTLPSASALSLPFLPGRNAAVAGRKYSIVGPMSREVVFGRIATRWDVSGVGSKVVAEGVGFPRDLRDCEVCHAGAPQAYEVLYGISRRTCAGCHPDVWFQDTPITDAVHFAHAGGPQLDDTECRGCHVAATTTQPRVYVRISDAHRVPSDSPWASKPVARIVSVANLVPGGAPTVVLKLTDRAGDIAPANAPTPAVETSGPTPSPVPRALSSLRIVLAGPTAPDYGVPPASPITSGDTGNPNILTTTPDPITGEIGYTFASTLPVSATGTWAVGVEGRRRATVSLYDPVTDTFRWPYTGESVSESMDNPIVYVDTATGSWTEANPGAAVPRRTIVSEERCLQCHGRFELHGSNRHQVAHCLLCHTPDRTDWTQRPKANGNVNLAATYDGIEERTVHFKVMIHRIHTGGRAGSASLEGIEPHVISGNFFDEAIFPNDLARCTLCHEGTSYRLESVPADAPPTTANETPTIRHAGTSAHVAGEPAAPPVQAACLGCHANGFTQAHAVAHTEGGVEQCAQCHVRGAYSVDVAHGLAPQDAPLVSASFSSLVQGILVPRCASAACHGGSPPPAFPRLDAEAAWDAIVGVDSQQASGVKLVQPFDPGASYMLLKMRGDAGSVGGLATPMPIGDAMLDASDLAAFEAWIANGAPND